MKNVVPLLSVFFTSFLLKDYPSFKLFSHIVKVLRVSCCFHDFFSIVQEFDWNVSGCGFLFIYTILARFFRFVFFAKFRNFRTLFLWILFQSHPSYSLFLWLQWQACSTSYYRPLGHWWFSIFFLVYSLSIVYSL